MAEDPQQALKKRLKAQRAAREASGGPSQGFSKLVEAENKLRKRGNKKRLKWIGKNHCLKLAQR